MNQAPRDPRVHRPELDEAVAKFLLKAIDRDANKRFQTPGEFRDHCSSEEAAEAMTLP